MRRRQSLSPGFASLRVHRPKAKALSRSRVDAEISCRSAACGCQEPRG